MAANVAGASTSVAVKPQRVAVIGGGPAGALMALYLSRMGDFEVDLFEALEESKIAGPTSRSWNVILFDRGNDALKGAGLDLLEEAGDFVVTVAGRVRHNAKQKRAAGMADGTKSICRGDLAMALLNKARQSPRVKVHFGCTFSTMDVRKRVATFEREDGQALESSFDMLVGADGVNSRVRRALQDHAAGFTVREQEDEKAFKVFEAPVMDMEGAEESWMSCIHSSNSKKGSITASPRSDGVITAALILPKEGKVTFETLMSTTQDVREYFGRNHPGIFGPEGPHEAFARNFLEQRPKTLRTIYCSQLALESVVLIGDAAHAMSASLGQGTNCALEDCQILAQVLAAEIDQAATTKVIDIPKVLEAYGRLRLEEVHAVCTLSNIASMISTRKILVAQLVLTVMLSKTLGRLAPKVFPPPSLFSVSDSSKSFRSILRGVVRESGVAKVIFGSCALMLIVVARRAVLRI
ncbi:unnamed protein product [Sphacelaria rigidula]